MKNKLNKSLCILVQKLQIVTSFFLLFFLYVSLINVYATNLTISLPTQKAIYGQSITIPISIVDASDLWSIEVWIDYDKEVLEYKSINTTEGLLKDYIFASNDSDGTIKLSGAGISAINGSGTLAEITFTVKVNESKSFTNLHISLADANEGDILTQTFDGKVNIASGFDYSGNISYYSNSGSVKGVSVSLKGNNTKTAVTDGRGNFDITTLPTGEYVLEAVKNDQASTGISSYDASLVLQASVGLINLNNYQIIAADVSGNGSVSSFDASQILRKTVGLIKDVYPDTNKLWSFVYQSSTVNINGDVENAGIIAILLGDVSGNWVSPTPLIPNKPVLSFNSTSATTVSLTWDNQETDGYEIYVSHNLGDYTLLSTQSSVGFTHNDLLSGDSYSYKIRTFYIDGNRKIFSDYSSILQKHEYEEISLMDQGNLLSLDVNKDDNSGRTALINVMEGLVRQGQTAGDLVPGVAQSWTYDSSNYVWTFNLNSEAYWVNHQGIKQRAVTASDFVYSWDRLRESGLPYSFIFNEYKVSSYEAFDEKTFKVYLSEDIIYFPSITTLPALYPIPRELENQYGTLYGSIMSKTWYNGPYYVSEWNKDIISTWIKNTNYWDSTSVKTPKINLYANVDYSQDLALDQYQQGKIDLVQLSETNAQTYQGHSDAQSQSDTAVFYLMINLANKGIVNGQPVFDSSSGNPLLDNKKIRQAIALYIDKQGIVDTILRNGAQVASYFVPKEFTMLDGVPFESTRDLGYMLMSKQNARNLFVEGMTELGYSLGSNNLAIDLLVYESDTANLIMEYIKNELSTLFSGYGVTVTKTVLPFSEKLLMTEIGDYDITFAGWGPDYLWPTSFLDLMHSTNPYNEVGYNNTLYDELISSEGKSSNEMFRDLVEAERILLEDAAIIPIYQRGTIVLKSENLNDVVYHPLIDKYSYKWAYKIYDINTVSNIHNLKIVNNEDDLLLTWNSVLGAEGYEIYSSVDGVNYTLFSATTLTSYSDNNVSEDWYYYRVRAYRTVNSAKIFGAYSTVSLSNYTQMKIAYITDTSRIDDFRMNQDIWNEIKKFGDESNVSYEYFVPTNVSTSSYLEVIDSAISTGSTVIVAPSWTQAPAIYRAQNLYPKVKFILLESEPHSEDYSFYQTSRNVYSIYYNEVQAGYLAGYAAVKDGNTRLGFIGGMAVPTIVKYGNGFIQGAEAAAKESGVNVDFLYGYVNSFAPDESIKLLANSWFEEGTQVIFSVAGSADISVLSAAEEQNKLFIGADYNYSTLSAQVLTSAKKNYGLSVYNALEDIANNVFKGGEVEVLGINENAVLLPMDVSRFTTFSELDYLSLINTLKNNSRSIIPITDIQNDLGLSQLSLDNLVFQSFDEQISVQNFVGLSNISQAGLKELITYRYSSTAAKGIVISQSINEDNLVSFGTEITLVVSNGDIPIINKIGSSLIDLENWIASMNMMDANLTLNISQEYSDLVKDTIISQSPDSGTVAPGTSISVTISKGSIPTIALPDLAGLIGSSTSHKTSEEIIRNYLESAGFSSINIASDNYGIGAGLIYSQLPLGGTVITSDTNISVNISKD